MKFSWKILLAMIACIVFAGPAARSQSLDDLGELFGESTDSSQPERGQADQEAPFDPFAPGDTAPPDEQRPPTQEEVQQQIQELMSQAENLKDEDKYGDAVAIYSRILSAYPDRFDVEFERAKSYVELKEYGFAEIGFQNILDSYAAAGFPDFLASVRLERGKMYITMQQFDEALVDLDAAIQSNPASAESVFLRGKALVRAGQLAGLQGLATIQQAIPSLNRAISLDPQYIDAYAERALAHVALQEYNKAVEDIDRAVELDEANVNYQARYGIILARRASSEKEQFDADMDQVVSDLRAAIERYDKYLASEGRKSRHDFRDAPPDTVTPDTVYTEKVSAEIDLGDEFKAERAAAWYQAAVDDCEAAIEYDDRSWIPLYQRGIAQRMLGQLDEAIDSFTHAMRLAPSPELLLRRGIAFYHQGQTSQARLDFRQAIETQQNRDGRAKFWIGATHASEGSFLEAIRYYSEALRENPEYKPAYNNRGLAFLQTRQFRRAAEDFEQLLRRNPDDEVAQRRRDQALELARTGGF